MELLQTAAKAPPSSHRTCKSCKGHLSKDASKCGNCGTAWNAESSAATPAGANAPYKIKKSGAKWAVVNNAGETKSSFDSHEKALSYLRALYVNVSGAAKRAKKVKFSGKAKSRIPK